MLSDTPNAFDPFIIDLPANIDISDAAALPIIQPLNEAPYKSKFNLHTELCNSFFDMSKADMLKHKVLAKFISIFTDCSS